MFSQVTKLALGSMLLITSVQVGPVSAQQHTTRGTLLGGVAGALAGAAIGDRNNEAAAGALIGGVIGGLTGATIGNSVDQEQARTHAYYQQRLAETRRAVTTVDVVTMTRNGLGDSLIINQIREFGVARRLEVSDVIALHQQGVSEPVITAMQQAPLATTASPPYSGPIVIERERYVSPPVIVTPAPYYHYRYHPHPYYCPPHYRHPHRSGVSWSVNVRN
jgi:hypothetical protein